MFAKFAAPSGAKVFELYTPECSRSRRMLKNNTRGWSASGGEASQGEGQVRRWIQAVDAKKQVVVATDDVGRIEPAEAANDDGNLTVSSNF